MVTVCLSDLVLAAADARDAEQVAAILQGMTATQAAYVFGQALWWLPQWGEGECDANWLVLTLEKLREREREGPRG